MPSSNSAPRRLVSICQGRSCLRSGSDQVLAAFQQHLGPNLSVCESGCTGLCSIGPTVSVMPDQTWYCRITPEDVETIVSEHLQGNRPVERLLNPRIHQTCPIGARPTEPPVA